MFCLMVVVVYFYIEIKHVFNNLFHISTSQLFIEQEREQILCLLAFLVSMTAEMEIINLEDLGFFYNLQLQSFPKLLCFTARGRRK